MPQTGVSNTVQLVGGVVVLLAILGVAVVLTWHGSITGEACVAILGSVLGAVTGAGAVHVGQVSGSKAAARGMNAARSQDGTF